MGQDGAAARVVREKTANAELTKRLNLELAKQLVKDGLGPFTADS